MTAGPRATGIIIVRDGEAFLDDAIASVLEQTFGDWELLIVDDGSTDASREIARRHASADPRIRSLAHPDGGNHGMSATRNLGLAHARGELVGFLDADDVWMPTKLAEQLAVLDDHPDVAMVYGRTLIWRSWDADGRADSDADTDADGALAGRLDDFYELGVEPDRVHEPPVLFRNLLRNVYQTPTTCNALMRRSAVLDVGGFEESFAGMFEDQVLFAKLLLRHPTFVSDRCWAKYRQHPLSSSAVSAAAGRDAAQHARYLRWLRGHLRRAPGATAMDRLAVERTLLALQRRRFVARARRSLRRLRRSR